MRNPSDSAADKARQLQDAYLRLFRTTARPEDDAGSLAQPYALRYVPSITTDNSNPSEG